MFLTCIFKAIFSCNWDLRRYQQMIRILKRFFIHNEVITSKAGEKLVSELNFIDKCFSFGFTCPQYPISKFRFSHIYFRYSMKEEFSSLYSKKNLWYWIAILVSIRVSPSDIKLQFIEIVYTFHILFQLNTWQRQNYFFISTGFFFRMYSFYV